MSRTDLEPRRRLTRRAGGSAVALVLLLFAACGDETTAPVSEPVVARVELSTTALDLAAGQTHAVIATPRTADGTALTGHPITWSSGNAGVATVNASGTITAVGVGATNVTAAVEGKQATVAVRVAYARAVLAGAWRMASLDGAPLPVNYRVFHDELIDGRIVRVVEIRLDSATKRISPGGRYDRAYWFTELHDGVTKFHYMWGDFGMHHLTYDWSAGRALVALQSDYYENLATSGEVEPAAGALLLREEIWLQEELHNTRWVRR